MNVRLENQKLYFLVVGFGAFAMHGVHSTLWYQHNVAKSCYVLSGLSVVFLMIGFMFHTVSHILKDRKYGNGSDNSSLIGDGFDLVGAALLIFSIFGFGGS